jgi:hypothetical protein
VKIINIWFLLGKQQGSDVPSFKARFGGEMHPGLPLDKT